MPARILDTDSAILQRKTTKVLAADEFSCSDLGTVLHELLALAGMAPFHRACDDTHRSGNDSIGIEPWRCHVLDATTCRKLRSKVPQENAGKIPSMLSAADALIMTTWLPNPSSGFQVTEQAQFEPSLANMEHIAAVAAAIQNLLLAATARGIDSYWSSGGILRSEAVFDMLGISKNEILLGAVFLFPEQTGDAEVVGSKLRERRTSPDRWSRFVRMDE